jgi:FKBP-type peptidyl-prolyl cis-trans isomerase SlyD
MSLMIGKNAVVAINYTLTDDQGEVMDTSEGRGPLMYLHGAGNLIAGLEKELEGKSSGQSFKASISPADAYGESDPAMIQVVPREMFRGVDNIEPGMGFTAQGPDGGQQRIVVTAVEGDQVTVDANHPMAGKTLHFDVEIVSVRDASAEEIAHGHVHDGHEHH